MNVTDKASALDFLDRLAADPPNPELCREFGIEIVPAEFAANLSPDALAKLELAVAYFTRPDFRSELNRSVFENLNAN